MVRRILLAVLVLLGVGIALAAVVLYAPDLERAELVARYGQPPSQFLTLPSGDVVHWRDEGNKAGPPVVLLHGSNASLHTWEPWVARLGERYRIITLDLPAHGLTGPTIAGDYSQDGMVAFVAAFTRAIGLRRFVLGGNSMGGAVALRYAGAHPDQVQALVLVSSAGIRLPNAGSPPIGFQLMRTPGVRELFRYVAPRGVIENGLKAAFVDDALVTPEMVDRYWALNRGPGQRAATIARFSTPPGTWIEENVQTLSLPVLMLWGREDRLTPLGIGQILRERLPQAYLIVYDNVGHIAHEEVPDLSAGDARQFLDRVTAAP